MLGFYLAALALVVVIQLRDALDTGMPKWLSKRVHWANNAGHFLLGGLLSAYLIYYVKGAPLLRASVWVLVLGCLAVAHELAPKRLKTPATWVPVLVVLAFHYALAVGPVLYGDFIGERIPVAFAVLLAAMVHVLATVPWPGIRRRKRKGTRTLAASAMGVGLVVVLEIAAFRADLVPPIPLTLMSSSVVPEEHEAYEVSQGEQLLARIGWPPELEWTPGLRVEVRTPVFLPAKMSHTLRHVWEVEQGEEWVQTDSIPLEIRGGRELGFRTYSRKRALREGRWRVRVTTDSGRELGRVRFDLRAVQTP